MPDASMIPGRSFASNSSGRSADPVASTIRPARIRAKVRVLHGPDQPTVVQPDGRRTSKVFDPGLPGDEGGQANRRLLTG